MSRSEEPLDPCTAFSGGDRARGEMLRRDLETIRDRVAGPELARKIEEALQGRLPLRALRQDPDFATLRPPGVDEMVAAIRALPREELEALAREQGERLARRNEELSRLRSEARGGDGSS